MTSVHARAHSETTVCHCFFFSYLATSHTYNRLFHMHFIRADFLKIEDNFFYVVVKGGGAGAVTADECTLLFFLQRGSKRLAV